MIFLKLFTFSIVNQNIYNGLKNEYNMESNKLKLIQVLKIMTILKYLWLENIKSTFKNLSPFIKMKGLKYFFSKGFNYLSILY